jgi:hypothetical protein
MPWGNKYPDMKNDPTYLEGRVSNVETSLAQKAQQADLNTTNSNVAQNTANIATNTANIASHSSQIAALASGSPKPVSLVSQMTDNTKSYVYTGTESGYTSGHWYYWNGSAWADGGVYQSAGIADQSVKLKSLNFKPLMVNGSGKNLINKNTVTTGYYVRYDNGQLNALGSYSASDYIDVSRYRGQNLALSMGEQTAFYDVNKVFISGNTNVPYPGTPLVVPSNAFYIRVSIPNTKIDTAQLEVGSTSTEYEQFGNYLTPKVSTAYVETNGNDSTAIIGQRSNPFATINAALDSLSSTGGIIKIGVGRFAPVDKTKVKDNVSFIGTKKPQVNSDYSGLLDGTGTIINGAFQCINHNNIDIRDLGVDSGANICASLYSNSDTIEGITISPFNIGGPYSNLPLLQNIKLENVIAITKNSTVSVHTILVEGVQGAYLNNLETYWGMFGMALKLVKSQANNLRAHGGGTAGITLRHSPNYYAPLSDSQFSNLFIDAINSTGAGLYIWSDAPNNASLQNVNVDGINIIGTSYGIEYIATDHSYILNCNLNNIVIDGSKQYGIYMQGYTLRNSINNVSIIAPSSHAVNIADSKCEANQLNNIKIIGVPAGTNAKGFIFNGKNNMASNLYIENFTQSGIDNTSTGKNYVNGAIFNNVANPYTGDVTTLVKDGVAS